MDKQRKIIIPAVREEIVRFVVFETKGYAGEVELPGLYCAACDHYSLVTDNGTYKLKVYKDRKSVIARGGVLLTDSELPSTILLKGHRSCEFPELPENGKPGCEKWIVESRRPHTEAESARLHREALKRGKTVSKAQDHKAVAPHARKDAASSSVQYGFRRSGDYWEIVFEGRQLPPVRHLAGMTYLHALLSRPGHVFFARDMYEQENPPPPEAVSHKYREGAEIAAAYGTGGEPQRLLEGQTPKNLRRAKDAFELKLESPDLSEKQREHIEDQIEAIDNALSGCRVAKVTGGATFEAKEHKGPRQAVAGAIERAISAIAEKQYGGNLAKHLVAVHKGKTFSYVGALTWET